MPRPTVLSLHLLSPDIRVAMERALECESMADGLVIVDAIDSDIATNGADRDKAIVAYLLMFFLCNTGANARAVTIGESALPLIKSVELRDEWAAMLSWTSFAAIETSAFGVALRYAIAFHEVAQAYGEPLRKAIALNQLGVCFDRSGDPWQAERFLRESVDLARALHEPGPLVVCLNNFACLLIGKFYAVRGTSMQLEGRAALRVALPLLREAISITPPTFSPFNIISSEESLGEALVHAEFLDAAQEVLDAALPKALKHGFGAIAARIRCSMAELHLARADFALAASEFEALAKNETVLKNVQTSQRVHYGRYLAHRGTGALPAALRALELFRRTERESSLEQLKARSEFMMTRAEADQKQRQGVAKAYDIAREQASRAEVLERLAHLDELTGLGNRRMLDVRFPEMVEAARSAASPLAVLMLDLDFFKSVNDTLGHAMGDRALMQVAELLRIHTRPGDLLSRAGGEEFVIALPGSGIEAATLVCERLRLSVSQFDWSLIHPDLSLTVSVGLACAPEYNVKTLIERADLAMYRAKSAGRNRVVVAV
jgi:diguanylate cyclase (GGDEF)-like protein